MRNQSTLISLNRRELKELGRLQKTPAVSDILESIQTWCKPPKGFEKFFKDKPSTKAAPKTAESAAKSEAPPPKRAAQPKPKAQTDMSDFFKMGARSKSGGSGGGAGGFGGMPDAEKQKVASMIGMGAVGVLALLYMNQMSYRLV